MSYRTFHPNADTYEPPPSVLEQADDERYGNEFNTIVATFRIALETSSPQDVTIRAARVASGTFALAHEQPLVYFCDRYGFHAVLRALATAIEQPINPLGELQGD